MKVGIITMFYGSSNYGGVLQAYALVKAVEKLRMDVEQISYYHFSAYPIKKRIKLRLLKYVPIIREPSKIKLILKILKRSKLIAEASSKLIPHSSKVYTEKDIISCSDKYDAFITGSDQVWHGEWPAYFLDFVTSKKKKISYAASTGKNKLSVEELSIIQSNIADFNAISVREYDTQKELMDFLKVPVECVLDPTLILEKSDWDNLASNRRISGSYMFCYFLGADMRIRNLATE